MIVKRIEVEYGVILPNPENTFLNHKPSVRWSVDVEENDDLQVVKKYLADSIFLHMAELEHRIIEGQHIQAKNTRPEPMAFKTTVPQESLAAPVHTPPAPDLAAQQAAYNPAQAMQGVPAPVAPTQPNLYAPPTDAGSGGAGHAQSVPVPPRPPGQ